VVFDFSYFEPLPSPANHFCFPNATKSPFFFFYDSTIRHGVCGLARLSPRSLASVTTFLGVAALTVSLLTSPHSVWHEHTGFLRTDEPTPMYENLGLAISVGGVLLFVIALLSNPKPLKVPKVPAALLSGALFATGLATSQMVLPSRLFGFLNFKSLFDGDGWDPSLVCTLTGAVSVSFLSYQAVQGHSLVLPKLKQNGRQMQKPIMCGQFGIPTNRLLDGELLFGSALFGVGFGLSGLCPGPAMYLAAAGDARVIFCHWPAFVVGTYIAQYYKDNKVKNA
jgi:uncharacterized membrane protein YedE/YeeE